MRETVFEADIWNLVLDPKFEMAIIHPSGDILEAIGFIRIVLQRILDWRYEYGR